MCGLTGYLSIGVIINEAAIKKMATAIAHRGPDSHDYWLDASSGIAFGHRRLAVVDLSPAGAQPMHSASGRYVIAYNGEVYNHNKLRAEINILLAENKQIIKWRGHSDTETLLAGFELWGVVETLKRATGMFAFALWDKTQKTLTLGRDRLGEKPLYYGWQGMGNGRAFLFGSELKALQAHPSCTPTISRGALALYMRHNYVPAPHSIYENIFKLLPGHTLTITLSQPEPILFCYWSASEIAITGVTKPFLSSAKEVVNKLDDLLTDSISKQMMADVPLGAFLSGGVDSSTIVALMQAQSSRPVQTFTIGFNEANYNEANHAKAVAIHLNTQHTELYVTPKQAMDIIPDLPEIYCEPFADSSQIPTFLVAKLAKQHVTVSLSGDAGDEIFCGYNRYILASNIWQKLSLLPVPVRASLAKVINKFSPDTWNKVGKVMPIKLPIVGNLALLGDKLHKGAGVLASRNQADLYKGLVSIWQDPSLIVIGNDAQTVVEPNTFLAGNEPSLHGLSDTEKMMVLDMLTYLPDDILTKIDRAAMSVSLETRVPFLDHSVVEFAWQLPIQYKLRDGQSKWALRQVLYKYVPKELIERPKMGFGIPLDNWLRGPLKEWAETLLNEERLLKEGYFYPKPIRKKWQEHLNGQYNWAQQLWGVLMFQSWLENNKLDK